MKLKSILIVAVFVLGVVSLAQAGPQFSISFGAQNAHCRPYPMICPAPVYYYSPVVYYSYGPAAYYYYSDRHFSNVSPVVASSPPIYKVSNPVYITQPVTVYEGVPFRWRK